MAICRQLGSQSYLRSEFSPSHAHKILFLSWKCFHMVRMEGNMLTFPGMKATAVMQCHQSGINTRESPEEVATIPKALQTHTEPQGKSIRMSPRAHVAPRHTALTVARIFAQMKKRYYFPESLSSCPWA